MPEITGRMPSEPDPSRMLPCVLCLEPTDVLALAPGLDPPREVPLHVFCAGWLIVQYRRSGEGRITEGARRQISAYATRILELAPVVDPRPRSVAELLDPEAERRP